MNGFLHSVNFICKLILLVLNHFIVVIPALRQAHLEVYFSLFEFLLTLIKFGCQVSEEYDDILTNFIHPIVKILKIGDGVRNEDFGFFFSPFNCWCSSVFYDCFICLAFF
jgi:hypothetical protein